VTIRAGGGVVEVLVGGDVVVVVGVLALVVGTVVGVCGVRVGVGRLFGTGRAQISASRPLMIVTVGWYGVGQVSVG
jgi:hypothetical protein